MAEVFLGEDQLLDRPVAVKVLFPNLRAIQILSSASEEKRRQLPILVTLILLEFLTGERKEILIT
ncbi:MAG: hypothetical protein CM15mP49_35690 [Actinomycetota bacterium]|nr:MAG: hypothetical protein CM15mP49_35690 [Actinomycetota bacterium]